jgi:hypothetical protein
MTWKRYKGIIRKNSLDSFIQGAKKELLHGHTTFSFFSILPNWVISFAHLF